jgi:hypothetical protein
MRYRCARALDVMFQRSPDFDPDPDVVYRIISRELDVSASAWQAAPRTHHADEEGAVLVADQVVHARASQGLSHVFCLLGLVLPRDVVQNAFRALHTGDEGLRALALEYVESAVPRELRDLLTARIEGPRLKKRTTAPQNIAAKLVGAGPAIVSRLEAMAHKPAGDKTTQASV